MAIISKQQLVDIIENRPEGTDPAEIVQALVNKGHKLEDMGETKTKQPTTEKLDKSLLSKIGGGIVKGAAKVGELVTGGLGKGLTQAAFLKGTKSGRELQQLLEEGKITAEEYESAVPYGKLQTPSQIGAGTIQTALTLGGGNIASGAKTAGSAISRSLISSGKSLLSGKLAGTATRVLLSGTIPGSIFGLASGIQEEKRGKELTLPIALGALTGTVVASATEVASAFRQGVFKHRPANVIQRSLDVPRKYMERDIFNNKETIAQRIVNEGYKGTARQVKSQAEFNLQKYGNQIDDYLSTQKGTITKEQIVNQIKDILDDPFNAQHKRAMDLVLDAIPDNMTPVEANQVKITLASKVPQSYWNSADPNVAFKGEFYEAISSATRKAIERAAPQVRQLNSKWSTAFQTKLLTTDEIYRGAKQGLTGRSGIYAFIQNILDMTLRAPALATRSAAVQQNINNIADKMKVLSPYSRMLLVNYFNELTQK